MTIELARKKLKGVADDQNVAESHFGCIGSIAAGKVKSAIKGKPDAYLVTLVDDGDGLSAHVCQQGAPSVRV